MIIYPWMGCLHSLFNTHYYMRFAADGNVDHLTRVRLYSAGCHAFKKNKHSSFRWFFGNVLVIIFMEVDPRTMIVSNGTCARSVSVGIVM